MLSAAIVALVVAYTLAQLRFVLVCSVAPGKPAMLPVETPSTFPMVAIQVAAYREALALPELLPAILNLDWPRDRFFVQIIDDSSGRDAEASRKVVERFSSRGVRVDYLNRGSRSAYKAGALNHGLEAASGAELIAYFDADCRPRRDFLKHLVPRFSDPQVAAVQARWEYPNGSLSPTTIAQQAAFEYLFRYEYGLRALLGSPVYYLGSAAVWRRQSLEALGGWETRHFTAEDVDMGIRARAGGWRVLYEPTALADDDAVEDFLAFRSQQRRWAHAVMQAAVDGAGGLLAPTSGRRALLLDATGLMPHASLVMTLVTTALIVVHTVVGGARGAALDAAEWTFAALVAFSPAAIALVAAMRYFHPDRWQSQAVLLARAGFAAAATMTSFVFGLADFIARRRMEFVATPKGGQVAVVQDSRRRWLRMHYGPIVFDAAVAVGLLSGGVVAIAQGSLNAAVPALLLGPAFATSLVRTLRAVRRHERRMETTAPATSSGTLAL
jgi:hypothetical protein